jgi:hypothetical protein
VLADKAGTGWSGHSVELDLAGAAVDR